MVIGYTGLEPHEVQDVVQQLGYEFRGNSYHLLERNCARLACTSAKHVSSVVHLLTERRAACSSCCACHLVARVEMKGSMSTGRAHVCYHVD